VPTLMAMPSCSVSNWWSIRKSKDLMSKDWDAEIIASFH
jgi:hypothetical protein